MKLEVAIQQKNPFRNEWQKAVVNIIYTNNWIQDHHKTMFKPYGITPQQFNVLRILRGQHPNPISTSSIRERMLDKMSDVSRIVDRLVKKKLVIRKTCKSDKRLVDVIINQAGMDLLKELDARIIQLDGTLLGISEAEAKQLNELLDKLRSKVEKED